MKIATFTFLIFFVLKTNAQQSTEIFVPAGSSIQDVAPINKVYRYKNFVQGEIYFRDGSVTPGLFNYNFLNGEVEFISPHGDTLAIADEQAVAAKQIVIGKSTFFYNKGYLENVFENPLGKICKNQQFDVTNKEKTNSLNHPSSAGIETYGALSDNRTGVMKYDLVMKENLTLSIKTLFFFGDVYNNFHIANKKNLMKMFNKKKDAIEAYLQTHQVNFNSEEDLKNLFTYLQNS
jgi:hypothetical protein